MMVHYRYAHYLSSELEFGKYKHLTVKDVFRGSYTCPFFWSNQFINKVLWLASEVNLKQASQKNLNRTSMYTSTDNYRERTYLRQTADPKSLNPPFFFEKSESLFDEISNLFDNCFKSVDTEYLFNGVAERCSIDSDSYYFILSGNPWYFEWLILNTHVFFMMPAELKDLEKHPVNKWKGFGLLNHESSRGYNQGIFEFLPIIEKFQFTFSEEAHKKNEERYAEYLKR